MLVSVIIPVYKVENYLRKCVDSILTQTYKDLEIILVDDGSPDNCGKICDEYALKDKRIKVIHKENGGLSDARNAGLDICTGEYIAFVDSDDYVDEDYIATFMQYAHPGTIVCSGYKSIINDKVKNFSYDKILYFSGVEAIVAIQETFLASLRGYRIKVPFTVAVWNKLYPKDMFLKTRFPVGKTCEDGYIMFELLKQCKCFKVVFGATYNYVYRKTSISGTPTKKFSSDYCDCVKKQEQDVKEFPELLNCAKKITLNGYMFYYLNYIRGYYDLNVAEKTELRKLIKTYSNFITMKDKRLFLKYILILYCEEVLRLAVKLKGYLRW